MAVEPIQLVGERRCQHIVIDHDVARHLLDRVELHALPDGTAIGYRVLRGGRTLRWPIIEKVQFMDLNTIAIEVSVHNAYSKGAIPLNVQGIANVKLSSREGLLENSVERFLGRPAEYIPKLAKETLEANLRGVLATLTPEEVNEDRLGFASALSEDAGEDLSALGFHLDVLKIQNVSDERGYLEAIGRKKAAEAVRVICEEPPRPLRQSWSGVRKLDTDLAAAMMSINAVKGVEIGEGMAAATLTGEANADEISMGPDGPVYNSNHSCGSLGGIGLQQIDLHRAQRSVEDVQKTRRAQLPGGPPSPGCRAAARTSPPPCSC